MKAMPSYKPASPAQALSLLSRAQRRCPTAPSPGTRGRLILSLSILLLSCMAAAPDTIDRLRVGFTRRMFTDVNENDAKAAVKIWGQTVTRAQNIPTEPQPIIYESVTTLHQSLASKEVDAIGMSVEEYAHLKPEIRFDPIFVPHAAGKATEQYLLLAHRDGNVSSLADLAGRSLRFQTNIRSTLAPRWLDILLRQQGHPTASHFAGKLVFEPKLTKVVLPVFFRQSDACVVTRSGFESMSELSPQVAKQLNVIASSAELVPVVFVFRAEYSPSFRERLIRGMSQLKETPGGQQLLTIFQSDDLELKPGTFLAPSLELLDLYARLCTGTNTEPGIIGGTLTQGRKEALP